MLLPSVEIFMNIRDVYSRCTALQILFLAVENPDIKTKM
jgi:hypothetical protein